MPTCICSCYSRFESDFQDHAHIVDQRWLIVILSLFFSLLTDYDHVIFYLVQIKNDNVGTGVVFIELKRRCLHGVFVELRLRHSYKIALPSKKYQKI